MDSACIKERAILAPTNETIDKVNEHILSLFPGEG